MAAGHREPSAGHQLAVLCGRGTMPDTAGAMVYEEAVSCHGVALTLLWRSRAPAGRTHGACGTLRGVPVPNSLSVMCGRPLGCKSFGENSDGRVDCEHVSGVLTRHHVRCANDLAAPHPGLNNRQDQARQSRNEDVARRAFLRIRQDRLAGRQSPFAGGLHRWTIRAPHQISIHGCSPRSSSAAIIASPSLSHSTVR